MEKRITHKNFLCMLKLLHTWLILDIPAKNANLPFLTFYVHALNPQKELARQLHRFCTCILFTLSFTRTIFQLMLAPTLLIEIHRRIRFGKQLSQSS